MDRSQKNRFQPGGEGLEKREMLSTTALAKASLPSRLGALIGRATPQSRVKAPALPKPAIAIQGGNVTITGTDADDKIAVKVTRQATGGTVQILQNNKLVASKNVRGLSSVNLYGGNGNDALSITEGVQISRRSKVPLLQVSYTIDGGDGFDSMSGPAGTTYRQDPVVVLPPAEPASPTVPVAPTVPTSPTIPTAPTVPTTPTQPTTPTEPTNPTSPTNPTTPTNPAPSNDPVITSEIQVTAQAFINVLNQVRIANGLSTVSYDAKAEMAALIQAKQMNDTGLLTHNFTADAGVAYPTLSDRLAHVGLLDQVYGYWENAGWGYGGFTVDAALDMWVNSPAHYANLMAPTTTKVGFAGYGNFIAAVGVATFA